MSRLAQSLPDGPYGRLVAVGLTVATLGVLWLAVGQPLLSWYDARAEALTQRAMVARHMEALVTSLPALRVQARDAAAPAEELALAGPDSLAAAGLQQKLREIAETEGTVITSSEALPAEVEGDHVRIGLQVALEAPFPVLMHMLTDIAQARPRLLVDDLRLHATGDYLLQATFVAYAIRAGKPRGKPT